MPGLWTKWGRKPRQVASLCMPSERGAELAFNEIFILSETLGGHTKLEKKKPKLDTVFL